MAWENELRFDSASKVEPIPEMAELRKLPPNKLYSGRREAGKRLPEVH